MPPPSAPNHEFYPKLKATLITGLILVWCLFFARYITWDAEVYSKNPEQELLMEVDLGDVEQAANGSSGAEAQVATPEDSEPDDQEASPLDLSGEEKVKLTPPAPPKPVSKPVSKPPKAVPKKQELPKPTQSVLQPKLENPVVRSQIAPPPVPKAILSNKFVKTEIANTPSQVFSQGTAEQGRAGKQGAANGHEGAKAAGIVSGTGISVGQNLRNRGIVQVPKFNEKFNENASFRVEIRVSKEGNCSFLRVMRTNSSSPKLLRIVRQKVTELRFKPGNQEDVGYIDFVFKVVQ